MTLPPDEAFRYGLDFFGAVVTGVPAAEWRQPTPCVGWCALDVLGHVGTAIAYGTALLLGRNPTWEPADPPGSAVDAEPAAWWSALAGPAREAATGVDLTRQIDSPMGRRSIGDGLSFPAVDLFVHAWDLGRAVGVDVEIPAAAIEFAHRVIDPIPEERARSARVFAQPVPSPAGATASQALLSWTGRDPNWTPPR